VAVRVTVLSFREARSPLALVEIVERVTKARTFYEAANSLTDWARTLRGCEAVMLRMLQPGGPLPAGSRPLVS